MGAPCVAQCCSDSELNNDYIAAILKAIKDDIIGLLWPVLYCGGVLLQRHLHDIYCRTTQSVFWQRYAQLINRRGGMLQLTATALGPLKTRYSAQSLLLRYTTDGQPAGHNGQVVWRF